MAGLENRIEADKKSVPSPSIDVVDLWKESRIQQRSEGSGNQQRLTIGNEEYRSSENSARDRTNVVKGPIKFELPKVGFDLPKVPGT